MMLSAPPALSAPIAYNDWWQENRPALVRPDVIRDRITMASVEVPFDWRRGHITLARLVSGSVASNATTAGGNLRAVCLATNPFAMIAVDGPALPGTWVNLGAPVSTDLSNYGTQNDPFDLRPNISLWGRVA